MKGKSYCTYIDPFTKKFIKYTFKNNKELADLITMDDKTGIYYFCKDNILIPLMSRNDNPAYYEGEWGRSMWFSSGELHRTKGPAFTCTLPFENEEFFFYGLMLERSFFVRNKEKLRAIEHFIDVQKHSEYKPSWDESYYEFYKQIECRKIEFCSKYSDTVIVTDMDYLLSEYRNYQELNEDNKSLDAVKSLLMPLAISSITAIILNKNKSKHNNSINKQKYTQENDYGRSKI